MSDLVPPRSELVIDPTRTAVVNVDVQRCFVENTPLAAPDGPDVLRRINELVGACRAAGALVVHTRSWMRPDRTDVGAVMDRLVPPFIVALYTAGAESAELHPDLDVDERDIVLDKPRYGAFHATELELVLRHRGIDTVIVTGIATSICCETTAREAAVRDFHVLFADDATGTQDMAGVDAATLHRATCASLSMVFARIVSTDEVIRTVSDDARALAAR
ncbi:cysteine hydrolase family protein [Actinomycetospora aeridis]|uniref:Isochorismatase family cysteine hydrolase n=1 Tax=Actinomycetospora aeridis TaxID=3129231 RepID=A0ABU8NAY6_9PSEU